MMHSISNFFIVAFNIQVTSGKNDCISLYFSCNLIHNQEKKSLLSRRNGRTSSTTESENERNKTN